MKTQRRRGFTIVELVVVIAIIAVLAAVLIPTFASIIKKANDSAYLQERQSKQIEDLAEKVEKINYFTWEDFEKKLAEELAKVDTTGMTTEQLNAAVSSAVTAAMAQYEGEHATGNSGLTEEQVQKIVDEAMKGQLTTAQIEAIVNQAVSKVGGVSATDVQAIVKTAIAGMGQTGLNAAQVKAQIASAISSSNLANKADVEAAISKALSNFETLTAQQVAEIVAQAIENAKPSETSDTVYIAGDMTLAAGKTYILRTMNTINSVTLTVPNEVTVTKVIIDAPNVKDVQIVGAGTVDELEIQSTAMMSTHVHVKVTNMVVNSGRAVLEDGAKVTTLKAAPATNANVVVELSTGSAVTNPIVAEYQDHGTGTNDTIKVIDKTNLATVSIVASTELKTSGTTTTNVTIESNKEEVVDNSTLSESVVVNVTVGEKEYVADNTGKVETNGDYVARIGMTGYESLKTAIESANTNETVHLIKDDLSTEDITLNKVINIKLDNYTYGGTFVFTNDANGVAISGNATVTGAMARIDDRYYIDFGYAFVAVSDANDVITLLHDHSYDVRMNLNKSFILDLNGYTLKNTASKYSGFNVQGNITIRDSSNNQTGLIYCEHCTGAAILVGKSDGTSYTFTLESGVIQSETAIFDTYNNVTININGGKMISYSKYGTGDSRSIVNELCSGCTLNITGGEFRSDQSAKAFDTMSFDPMGYPTKNVNANSTIAVTGGSFSGQAIQRYVPGYVSDQSFSDTNPTIIVGNYQITRTTISSPYGAAPYDVYLYTVEALEN